MLRLRTRAATVLLLCLTVLPLAAQEKEHTLNLLRNGGFEAGWNDEDGRGRLWTWPPGLAGLDDSAAAEGRRSLRICVQGKRDMFDGLARSAAFQVLPETIYRVSARVRASGVMLHAKGAASAGISVSWYDGDWQPLRVVQRGRAKARVTQAASLTATDFDWRPLKGEVRSPPGARAARIGLAMVGATGTVWFDDVKFEYRYEINTKLVPLSRGSIYPTMYPELGIYQADGPPVIDGRDADDAWNTFPCMPLLPAYPGQHIADITLLRVCFDKEALYVYLRCHRSALAPLQRMKKATDAQVWKNDCVGVFLRVPGMSETYKIVVGITGAIYDAAGDRPQWNSHALVAVRHDVPSWSVEMKIPYRSLKTRAPELGAVWGINICRYRPNLDQLVSTTATANTLPDIVDFGGLKFHFKRQPARRSSRTPTATVLGRLLDESGPAAGVMVSIGPQSTRTSSCGLYCIKNAGFSLQGLVIHPGQHERFVARVFVKAARTYLPTIHVRAVDPRRLSFPADALPFDGNIGLSVHSYLTPAAPDRKPDAQGFRTSLRLRAAQGEYEPAAFAIYAKTPLRNVRISVGDLIGTRTQDFLGQNVIKLSLVRLQRKRKYVADRSVQRTVLCPEVLDPYTPVDLDANSFRDVWLSLHVPADAAPDTYTGAVEVAPENEKPVRLPIHVEVLPIRLADSLRKKHGVYAGRGTSEADLRDMKRHGVDIVAFRTASRASYSKGEIAVYSGDARRVLDRFVKSGLRGPVIVTPEPIEQITYVDLLGVLYNISEDQRKALYTSDVSNLAQIAATLQAGPVLFAPLDRPAQFAKQRKEWEDHCQWISGVSRAGIFSHKRLADLFRTEPGPRVRVRCYDARELDRLDMGEFRDMSRLLADGTTQAWFEFDPAVNVAGEKAEVERLANGFYLWVSPFEARMRWSYRDIHGDPYYDLDEELGEGATLTYPAPMTGAPVSTPQWEAYREGVDDLRYIATLEQWIRKAKKAGIAEAERTAAEQVLQQVRDEIDKYRPGMSRLLDRFGPEDYDRWRREIASAIVPLQKALPASEER
ncbi:MAG: hypothetical protein GXP25_18310 [Planctomycetes bacterium]|nr:hypothetical protein [Planctomycetota bacterium]